jgi:hypothetical protein
MSKLTEAPASKLRRLTSAATAGEPADAIAAPANAAPRFCNDLLAAAVVSVLASLTMAFQPSLWVHGRIHSSVDCRVGRTLGRGNPHRYRDTDPDCNPCLVAEIRS